MAGGGKRKRSKRSPTPSSESFGDSEYSAMEYSESGSGSLTPRSSSSPSSVNTDDSMGLTPGERVYIKAVERAGLADSDESDEESSDGEEGDEDQGDGDDEGDGEGDGDKGDDDSKGEGEGDGEGKSDGEGKGGEGSSKGGKGDGKGGKGDGKGSGKGDDGGEAAGGDVPPA